MSNKMEYTLGQVTMTLSFDGPFGSSAPAVDILAANDLEVVLEFDYEAGYEGRTWGRPEDCEPGYDPRVKITGIKCASSSKFESEGLSMTVDPTYDIMPFISERDVEELEEMIVMRGQE